MPDRKALNDSELAAVLAAARLFPARDQTLIHTGFNTAGGAGRNRLFLPRLQTQNGRFSE
jgi:hypothetical protein